MMNHLLPIATISMLLLVGCEKSANESVKAVDKARDNAAVTVDAARQDADKIEDRADKKVAAAQQAYVETNEAAFDKLSVVEAEAMSRKAQAEFEVASAEATGHHAVAKQKCDVLAGARRDACLSGADAVLSSEQALAVASRDAALVQAEDHE